MVGSRLKELPDRQTNPKTRRMAAGCFIIAAGDDRDGGGRDHNLELKELGKAKRMSDSPYYAWLSVTWRISQVDST